MSEAAEEWRGDGGLFVEPEGGEGPRQLGRRGERRLSYERSKGGMRILRRSEDWRERGGV